MYQRKYPLLNVMRRSIEITIHRDDITEFQEAAKEMNLEANIIPGQDDESVNVKMKLFFIKPADCYWFGIKFGSARNNKDTVF